MTAQSFSHMILPLRDKCYRFAASILNNLPESEDVAQDVLLKLWDRRHQLSQIDNVEAWAMRITRNLALDRMRNSHWRTQDTDGLYALSAVDQPIDQQIEWQEAAQAVHQAFDHLNEMQRAIFHLREIEEMSYDEIATQLEITPDQVKVYLHRARKRVRALIDPDHAPSKGNTHKS
jgi:RNA polymerase sigma factor, sigma-70 family